ncbi:MAG TPA: Xaa-Pro peptidase family protein [Nocardioidaceae bacterium]|nr:Xaa-Pro peptidase family protein [Nocardioidaceae bacterium]
MRADLGERIARVRARMRDAGVDGLVVTPGADLRYLTGYPATALERLTALVLAAEGDPTLVVPTLEAAEARRSPAAQGGLAIRTYAETDDALELALGLLGDAASIAVDDHMWASRVLAVEAMRPAAKVRAAGSLLSGARVRKDPAEVAALRAAAEAIDRVHARMGEFLRVGRTERAAGRRIAEAIVEEGHARADFVIVGSGPNGASPHHTVSDRVLAPGDPVVVDIGGATDDGYCSDSTRTYAVGELPGQDFLDYYAVLQEAQLAQCDRARPGVAAESVDAVGRQVIEAAGYGECFFHRTGHGIGLETHEEPYLVAGNATLLEAGMAFSIEPGIYRAGRDGARIEDIVVTTDAGSERLNRRPRELTVVGG